MVGMTSSRPSLLILYGSQTGNAQVRHASFSIELMLTASHSESLLETASVTDGRMSRSALRGRPKCGTTPRECRPWMHTMSSGCRKSVPSFLWRPPQDR